MWDPTFSSHILSWESACLLALVGRVVYGEPVRLGANNLYLFNLNLLENEGG